MIFPPVFFFYLNKLCRYLQSHKMQKIYPSLKYDFHISILHLLDWEFFFMSSILSDGETVI